MLQPRLIRRRTWPGGGCGWRSWLRPFKMGVADWLAAVDDIDLMQAGLDEAEHRIGLAVVDDDALTSRDLIGQDERDGAGAIQHVHVGHVVLVGLDAVRESVLRVGQGYGPERRGEQGQDAGDLLVGDQVGRRGVDRVEALLGPDVRLARRQPRGLVAAAVQGDEHVDVVAGPDDLHADAAAAGELEADLEHAEVRGRRPDAEPEQVRAVRLQDRYLCHRIPRPARYLTGPEAETSTVTGTVNSA